MPAAGAMRDVLPYFRRAESVRRRAATSTAARTARSGTRRGALENPLHAAWLEAGRQAGYPTTADMNGFQQEGFGYMDMTVADGRRCSAANAYLRPAMRRTNLACALTRSRPASCSTGRRAVGVRYRRGGERARVRVRREVIAVRRSDQLAAAAEALGRRAGGGSSPQLGIDVVHELPGVGENLQDHLEFYFQVACREPITLYSADERRGARQ